MPRTSSVSRSRERQDQRALATSIARGERTFEEAKRQIQRAQYQVDRAEALISRMRLRLEQLHDRFDKAERTGVDTDPIMRGRRRTAMP